MPCTKYFRAEISLFKSSTPTVLYGEELRLINDMQSSISKYGLLSPITVSRQGPHLMVIDGRKRLAAIRRLQFKGDLPQNLDTVPYVIVNTVRQRRLDLGQEYLPLLNNDAKYNLVMDMRDAGLGVSHISDELGVSKDFVHKIAQIGQLSAHLQQAFLDDSLTIDQVHAFASIPNVKAQTKLLEMLGPYVEAPSVIEALQAGETVLEIDNENVLVLPSRAYKTAVAA